MKIAFSLLALVLFVVPCVAQNVSVLMYHKTSGEPSEYAVNEVRFKEHVYALKSAGFNTLTVTQLARLISENASLPEKTVVLTFDDGWKDNRKAAEVLKSVDFTATFYVLSGSFNDSRYLSVDDLQYISSHFEIGAHSHTHFIEWENDLPSIPSEKMIYEIVLSKIVLNQITGQSIESFAWPYSYERAEVLQKLPSLGFTSAVIVMGTSKNSSNSNPLTISRLNVSGDCTGQQVVAMASTGILDRCTENLSRKKDVLPVINILR